MRSVRCDACGTKALMAASQCPKCGHLFEVRDGFGDLLPLAYCTSCDSYYPASAGACRWCGTAPAPAPKAPYIWKGAGIAALAAVIVTGWFLRDTKPKKHTPDRQVATARAPEPVLVPVDTAVAAAPIVPVDTAPTPVATPQVAIVQQQSAPPARPVATRSASATAAPKARTSARWVNAVAKGWVVIRVDARKNSHIVASIGPDSRVQLGESRGAWRRIRARGLAGWVDAGSPFGSAVSPARTRGLSAR